MAPRVVEVMRPAGGGNIALQNVGSTAELSGFTITSAASASLQAVTTRTGNITVTSTAITLAGNLHTDRVVTSGSVTLTGAVSLAAAVAIDTDNTGADGSITVNGTIDGNQALTLTAGSGNIVLQSTGAVGGTTRLGAFTIFSATNVSGTSVRAASITQTAASGTTTFTGALDANAAGGISLTGTNFTLSGGLAYNTSFMQPG